MISAILMRKSRMEGLRLAQIPSPASWLQSAPILPLNRLLLRAHEGLWSRPGATLGVEAGLEGHRHHRFTWV